MSPVIPFVVAVDGPAGSGKSSVSRRRRGASASDSSTPAPRTGRSPGTLEASGVDTDDEAPSSRASTSFDYRIGTDPTGYAVHVGETDVTDAIRDPRISAVVSRVARAPRCARTSSNSSGRSWPPTRRPASSSRGVTSRRSSPPTPPVRILLTASEEVRAARRSAELVGSSTSDVGEQIRRRDAADAKVVDFMTAAEGVTTVDSTELDFDQTVEAVIGVIRSFSLSLVE